jgi:chromosomal replication initiation ATPase DnaA
VLHACRKIAELKTENPDIGRDFEALIHVLRS